MKEFDELVGIVKKLRSPNGCPWDRAQKVSDTSKHLLEEVYELIEGIDKSDPKLICEEIGDVMLLLVFLAQIFSEKKKFHVQDAIRHISQKLIGRHPHVFSNTKVKDKHQVLENWIQAKAKIKKRKTVKERLPKSAPALLLAQIFFKELRYLDEKKFFQIQDVLSPLPKTIKLLSEKLPQKQKEKLFTQAVFSLARAAFCYDIDLETLLRKEIFAVAKKKHY